MDQRRSLEAKRVQCTSPFEPGGASRGLWVYGPFTNREPQWERLENNGMNSHSVLEHTESPETTERRLPAD